MNTKNSLFRKAPSEQAFDDPLTLADQLTKLAAQRKQDRLTLLVVCIVFAIAVASLFPLKTVVPVRVETNAQTGEIFVKGELKAFTPDEANVRYWTGEFVLALTRVERGFTYENQKKFGSFLTGSATKQWEAYLQAWNPFELLQKSALYVRSAQLIGPPSLLGDGGALIRVKLTEPDGRTWIQRWTLRYVINPPRTTTEISANPAGLFITHLEYITEQ